MNVRACETAGLVRSAIRDSAESCPIRLLRSSVHVGLLARTGENILTRCMVSDREDTRVARHVCRGQSHRRLRSVMAKSRGIREKPDTTATKRSKLTDKSRMSMGRQMPETCKARKWRFSCRIRSARSGYNNKSVHLGMSRLLPPNDQCLPQYVCFYAEELV